HDHAARVERRRRRGKERDDAAVLDADVAHFTVDAVRRIVHVAAGNAELAHGDAPPCMRRACTRSRTPRTTRCTAPRVSREPVSDGRRGSDTSSILSAVPPSWIPATPLSMTAAAPVASALSLARGP